MYRLAVRMFLAQFSAINAIFYSYSSVTSSQCRPVFIHAIAVIVVLSNDTIMQISPNSTWLVTSRHVSTRHDTFDVPSPCILAVSSLSNSTARHARHDELDMSNVSCRVETWRDEPSGIWGLLYTMCVYHVFLSDIAAFLNYFTQCRTDLFFMWRCRSQKTVSMTKVAHTHLSCVVNGMLGDFYT